MFHFTVPTVIPRTLEELHPEPDEVTSLVYYEDAIAKELNLIRNHNKDVPPLGQLPQQEDSASDAEEEVNDGSPVSEEESEEGTGTGESTDEDADDDDEEMI